jgi:hypothetical protein
VPTVIASLTASRRGRALVAVAGLASAFAAGAVPLAPKASATPTVTTLSTAYTNPSQLAVHAGGRILVTDGRYLREVGKPAALAVGPKGGEIAGVALDASGGTYAYASSAWKRTDTWLTIVGTGTIKASLMAYERRYNPDRGTQYGVAHPSKCVRDAFRALDGGPAGYTARVASHPVAVANSGSTWYVADASANDIMKVDSRGRVVRFAVLPRQPFVFTKRVVSALNMPSCVVGVTYYAEPTPTDVEVGPGGTLYVTTLPALYDLGQSGSVYRIDGRTRSVKRLVSGFAGAANVAVTPAGTVYVAERLTGRISVVVSGRSRPYLSLPGVTAVEAVGTTLYAAVAAPVSMGVQKGPGRIVRIG